MAEKQFETGCWAKGRRPHVGQCEGRALLSVTQMGGLTLAHQLFPSGFLGQGCRREKMVLWYNLSAVNLSETLTESSWLSATNA